CCKNPKPKSAKRTQTICCKNSRSKSAKRTQTICCKNSRSKRAKRTQTICYKNSRPKIDKKTQTICYKNARTKSAKRTQTICCKNSRPKIARGRFPAPTFQTVSNGLGQTRSTDIVFVYLLFDLHRREALVLDDLTLSGLLAYTIHRHHYPPKGDS